MEILDFASAVQVLDNYTMSLTGFRTMVEHHLGKTYDSPEMAMQVASLQDGLRELFNDSSKASIALFRLERRQASLLVNYLPELTALINAQTRNRIEIGKTLIVLDKIEQQSVEHNPDIEKTPVQ